MNALLYTHPNDELMLLTTLLHQADFDVHALHNLNFENSEEWMRTQPCDLLLIACDHPADALERAVRAVRSKSECLIVLLLEQATEREQVALLDAGCDRVQVRPYSTRLFMAQLRAARRRIPTRRENPARVTRGPLTLDVASHKVLLPDQQIRNLTPLEFRLLHLLASHPGQVFSSEMLVERVWGYHGQDNRDLVRGLVQRLRAKIEPDPSEPTYIHNQSGIGYYFNAETK